MPSSANLHRFDRLLPFLAWGRSLSRDDVRYDLIAGITGAVMVLPQGVAYALIAGMPAEYGLYGAMVVAAIAGLFGSSRHLVTGPAAALAIMLFSVLAPLAEPGSQRFIELGLLLTLLTGVIQLVLGLARAGNLVAYISHTVVVGFTSGAAVLIATSQLGHALGLEHLDGGSLLVQWQQLLTSLSSSHGLSLLIALVTLATTLLVKRLSKRIPAMLVGMLVGAGLCWLLDGQHKGVAMVGEIPSSWPLFHVPEISLELIAMLLPGALTVALLGLVEAAAIARSIAIRSGQRIDANQEFVGQGLANLVGSLFSSFAGSGSFTRSGLNYDSGARSPLAVVSSALFLLVILLLLPDVTEWIPLPAMAGGILLIAWNLFDFKQLAHFAHSDRREWVVFVVTLVATLTIRLEFAVLLGVVVSLLLFLDKTARPNVVEVAPMAPRTEPECRNVERLQLPVCPEVRILRIDGAVFFGSADHIQQSIQHFCEQHPQVRFLILNCTGVHHIDLAGAEMLLQEQRRLQQLPQQQLPGEPLPKHPLPKQQGVELTLCWLKNLLLQEPDTARLVQQLGPQRVFDTSADALAALVPKVTPERCQNCTLRVFRQCPAVEPDWCL